MRYTLWVAESLLDQCLEIDRCGVRVVSGALDLFGLGQYPVGGAGVAEFEDSGVAPIREQFVQVSQVLGPFDPVEHDVPLVVELGSQRRGQTCTDGLWVGWRDPWVRYRGRRGHISTIASPAGALGEPRHQPICPDLRRSAPSGTFRTVSVGGHHACGLRTDDTVTCWGRNDRGQTVAPKGTFRAVSAGEEHSCGLRTDNTIAC
jgi:hypothetical protein